MINRSRPRSGMTWTYAKADGIYTEVRGTAPNRRFIVQYDNIEHRASDGTRPRVTFQVVLFETTGQIEFRYESVDDDHNNVAIGITDGTGTNYAEVGIGDTQGMKIVNDDTRIVFTPFINIVTKDAADKEVATYDILEEISALTGMITVGRADNNDWDGNQVYTVELDSPTPLVVADATGTITYTIMDDDKPDVILERVSGTGPIAEGNVVALRARLTNAPDGAPETLTVNLDVGVASTANNNDHNLPPSVTIDAGDQVSDSFMLTITDDNRAELEEVLTIEVGALTYGTPVQTVDKLPTPEKIDLTIPIDPADTITAVVTATGADEGDMATVNITLDRMLPDDPSPSSDALRLVLEGTDRAGDVIGSEWDLTADLQNSLSTDVMIPLVDDTLLEGAEKVTVSVRWVAALNDIITNANPPEADFTINDNDFRGIGIVAPTTTSYEEGDTVMLTVGFTSAVATAFDIDVVYRIEVGGTADQDGNTRDVATAPDIGDTVNSDLSVTIPAGGENVDIRIVLSEDSIPEKLEVFSVFLVRVSSSDAALDALISVSPTSAEPIISINDNEPLEYSFVEGSGMVSEDNTDYTVKLRRLGAITEAAMVTYAVSGIGSKPTDAADFASGAIGTFVFSNYNAESAEITLTVADDKSLESDENFQITAVGKTLSVILVDNEYGRIGIIAPTRTLYNEGDSFDLMVGLASGIMAAADINVVYRINVGRTTDQDGNTRDAATAPDIGDTVNSDLSVTIPAGGENADIRIVLPEDRIAEKLEIFEVTLVSVSSSDAALDARLSVSPGSAEPIISILDNEPLEYEFEVVGSGTVSEDNTDYTVELRRRGMIMEAATVAYTVSGSGSSSAVAADFDGEVFPSGNFVFTNYNASAEITLTVADDNSLEDEETFRITAAGETLDVKLVDNESGEVGITTVSTTSPEDGDMVQFDVSLPDRVTIDSTITVNFEIITPPGVNFEIIDQLGLVTVSASGLGTGVAQGLALPVRGLAQVARSYSIMIPAGQTSVILTIQLTHDGTTEVSGQLMVRLLSASTSSANPSLVVVGSNTGLANILLVNFGVPNSFGDLPATGGPVLPVWLLLTLALTGVVLLVPALWFKPRNTRK